MVVPGLLFYVAQSRVLEFLQHKDLIDQGVSLEFWKALSFITATVLSFYVVGVRSAVLESKNKRLLMQRMAIINHNKQQFLDGLKNQLKIPGIKLEQRLFVPKRRGLCRKFWLSVFKKDEFVIKNIPGLSNPGTTEKLSFEVWPEHQGLVGLCYKDKTIKVDDKIKENRDKYSLTRSQKAKTAKTEFVLCAPLFNNKDEVIYIISFDSNDPIKIAEHDEQMLIDWVTYYCQFFYECLPDLFE